MLYIVVFILGMVSSVLALYVLARLKLKKQEKIRKEQDTK